LDSKGKNTNLSIQKKEISKLLKEDQLWSQYYQYNYLPRLTEAPISFMPTYKFIKNTSCYDQSKSPPSWCDRILWSANESIKCTHYSSIDSLSLSDHKPVYGIYLITVKQRRGRGTSMEEEKDEILNIRKPYFTKPSNPVELYGTINI